MNTPLACVIGWPIRHSRSPVIHRFWLRELGLTGDYVVQPVEPENAEAFFRDFATGPYAGCNVTVPHKETAFAAMAAHEPAAEAIGAVNTVWLDGGRLRGDNTDAAGFLANLDAGAPGWDSRKGAAVVLGAGGAARSVVWALLQRGLSPVNLVNRTVERADILATRFGDRVRPVAWPDLPRVLAGARILVNTTSLGMAGQPDLTLDLSPLPKDALVNDIVYVPLETPLLAAARARRLAAVDGLGMLLYQAVPGFERWFGKRPEVTPALRAAVMATL